MSSNSIVAAIDEETFSDDGDEKTYIPILESLLFAVNKYLFMGAEGEDAQMYRESLIESYSNIPGAVSLKKNNPFFTKKTNILIIKSVPTAKQTKFKEKELVEMIHIISDILSRA